jgi:putative membrane protein
VTLADHFIDTQDAWSHWHLDPLIVAGLVATVTAYALVTRGRGFGRRDASFYAAMVVLALALLSPVDTVASILFSVHMVQHLLLMLVVAPLIAYARPWEIAFKPGPLKGEAAAVVVANVVGLWAWHLPAPYEAALRNDLLHGLEHGTFLVIGVILWKLAFDAPRQLRFGSAIAAFFVTALQSAALGAVLFLAAAPLYDVHVEPAYRWGIEPLHDQQLAGALMWVPPGFAYLATMIVLVWRWMAHYERSHPASERA